MKNTRRFISAVMALAMVSALAPMGAFASEGAPTKIKLDSTNNTGSMTATYDIEAKYTVTIPAGVTLSSTDAVSQNIEASGVMLESGQKIKVTLNSANHTTSGATFHAQTDKGDSTATYTIGKETATTGVKVGDVVAEFTENGTQTLTFSKAEGATYAGTHTETLTFGISVEETAVIKTLTIKKGYSIADSDTTIEYCEGDTWADAVERNPDKIAIDDSLNPHRIVLPGKTGNQIDLCKDVNNSEHLVLPTDTIVADGNYLWW